GPSALVDRADLHVLRSVLAIAVDLQAPGKSATTNLYPGFAALMNSNIKSAAITHADTARGFYRVAIVGAASLKGKEVAEVLDERNFPSTEVKLLDDDETLGQLEAVKEEMTFIQAIRAEQFENIDFTFFASDAESTLKNW